MMRAKPIQSPLQGERVVGLTPAPAARVTDWNRRLNLFAGRALTSSALTAEQKGHSGRLALRGQAVSPGVVQGLEISLIAQGDTPYLHIASGFGIAASGEDVFVPKPVRIALGSLPVFTTAALLDGVADSGTGELAPRRAGPPLAELPAKNNAVPGVGVIVLQPVNVDELANFDPSDQCEEDPEDDAFSDEQWLDGCRILYYAWPTEWLPLPAAGDAWRNRLAYAIFEAEGANDPDQVMPWELAGLPIAMVAFDEDWTPLFADRYAVVREGGKPRRRAPIVDEAGNEFLNQARILQFADHLASLDRSAPAAEFIKEFRYLPPAGLLPISVLKLASDASAENRVTGSDFFPGSYTVNIHPAPLEQLDLVARGSGSLAPFDTFNPDQVTVAIPVPQIWYEPDLLKAAKIDPGFQRTVDQFTHEREIWLKRRLDVRAARAALEPAITGKPVVYAEPDPDAVEDEQAAADPIDPAVEAFRQPEATYGTSGSGALKVNDLEDLTKKLASFPGVSTELPQLEKAGAGLPQFVADLQAKADHANDLIDTGFIHVQTDIYRVRQRMLGNVAASRLAVSPALAEIASGTTGLATEEKIESYLESLKPKLTPTGGGGGGSVPPPHEPGGHPVEHRPVVVHPPAGPRRFAVMPRAFVAGAVRPQARFLIQARGIEAPPRMTPVHAAHNIANRGAPQFFAAAEAARSHAEIIRQQRPIVGASYDVRNASVAERLRDPSSMEVKLSTIASKVRVITNFKGGGGAPNIAAGDIEIPGFLEGNNEVRKPLSAVDDQVLGEILAGQHDPIPDNPGEAQIFAAGVRAIEHTIEILRLMEQRVQIYLQAVELCHDAIGQISPRAAAAAARLEVIEAELAKARHDTSVAKALTAEEQARIDKLNARRAQIINQQVQFVAYYRPRTVAARIAMPYRWLDPGITAASVPACMARHIAAPDELREYVNLLREAPITWFRYVPPLLSKVDRLDTLHRLILNAKYRANFKLFEAPETQARIRIGPLAPHIAKVHEAQRQVVTTRRLNTAQVDMTILSGATWKESLAHAHQLISIGDLADLGQHHPEVPRAAASAIEDIFRVAAALYSDFCSAPPAVRLNWTERLIQLGTAVNLANLASLPDWAAVSGLERREMQALADWLFGRINPAEAEAVAHMNDLVRVCILLASHAPVTDIIAGSVIQPTSITAGAHVAVSADLARVHAGMHVLIYQANHPVARGVVEDLADGIAKARVLAVTSTHLTLAANTKAHFATPEAFSRHPLTASLKV